VQSEDGGDRFHQIICKFVTEYYTYPKISGLIQPSILWRQSGMFWIPMYSTTAVKISYPLIKILFLKPNINFVPVKVKVKFTIEQVINP
jgi:hypothetical protein